MLNVLVIHDLGDLSRARRTSVLHATFLQRYQPQHNYLFHDCRDPVTPALRAIRFHAVLFDVTFLCWRWVRPRARFEQLRERYAYLAETDAVRAAFPQDEYDEGETLDAWLADYRTDLVYTVLPGAEELVFPRTRRRAKIFPALTGYVEDADIPAVSRWAAPFAARQTDVFYRARNLPAYFGSHGQLKARLGIRCQEAARALGERGRPLRLDVYTRPEDTLLGEDWLRALGGARYTLGSEGGSSVWDPRGEIRDRCDQYLREQPQASFEEVVQRCLPGEDRQQAFSAISPRLFEAALTRTGQLLVEAPYLGALQPQTHYLALAPDLSNLQEVLEASRDDRGAEARIEATYAALVEPDTFRYSRHAKEVMAELGSRARGVRGSSPSTFEALKATHRLLVREHRARLDLERRARRLVPAPLKQALRRLLR
jgi:hypothetical protein